MTWIKTVPLSEVDEKLRSAMEGQRALYPVEYATPVHPDESGGSTIVGSHTLIPEALYHAFGTFGALMSPELPLNRPCSIMSPPVTSEGLCVGGKGAHIT
jgi:hypothetical protein